MGPFIQNTSGALPLVASACILVQYSALAVTWIFTLTDGWAASKASTMCCMAGRWVASHIR
ncbi:hypothetical protein OG278_29770 [Streptomyces sp. NBC_00455]